MHFPDREQDKDPVSQNGLLCSSVPWVKPLNTGGSLAGMVISDSEGGLEKCPEEVPFG